MKKSELKNFFENGKLVGKWLEMVLEEEEIFWGEKK